MNWIGRESPRSWISIASSADGTKLAAVVNNGLIYTSTDSGANWTAQTNSGTRMWISIASSSDGIKLAAAVNNGLIYTSTDSGATWTERTNSGSRAWQSIASSADGTKLVAADYNGLIYTSTDSGANWTARTNSGSRMWTSIASSSDGTKIAAVVNFGFIYTSTDSGASWAQKSSSRRWRSVASSSDGTILAAAVYGGYIYISSDSGNNWTERESARDWMSITSSSDGTKIAACFNYGSIYISTDSGVNWSNSTPLFTNYSWSYIASSSDGTKLAAVTSGSLIYTYPSAAPSAPQNSSIINGNQSLDISFNAPANNGGSQITSYQYSTNGGTDWITLGATPQKYTIRKTSTNTDLVNYTLYSVQVRAVNTTGGGDPIILNGTPYINWRARGSSRVWQSIASSSDGIKLAAAVNNGLIYTSTDSGATWTERTNSGSRAWRSIASSADGTKLVAAVNSGLIYTSTDSGDNWTAQTNSGSRMWISIASSSDGTKLAAVPSSGFIYTSTDSGASWTQRESSRAWQSIASSSDGTKLAATVNNGLIYTSTDSGATWTERTNSGSRAWRSIASSADGTKLAAAVNNGLIYTSTDSGDNWTTQTNSGSRMWISIASSSDGTKLAAVPSSGFIYISTDSGASWTQRESFRAWRSIASSSDGARLAAAANSQFIYTNPSAPSAPENIQSEIISGVLYITFGSPQDNGGAVISGYDYSTDGGSSWLTLGESAGSYEITTQSNGSQLALGNLYTILVSAKNEVGRGGSVSIEINYFTYPDAPTINSITSGNQQLDISFNAPASNGGANISGYEYSTNDGVNWKYLGDTAQLYTITTNSSNNPLVNRTTYTVQVRAVNAAGGGDAASAQGYPNTLDSTVNTAISNGITPQNISSTLITLVTTLTGSDDISQTLTDIIQTVKVTSYTLQSKAAALIGVSLTMGADLNSLKAQINTGLVSELGIARNTPIDLTGYTSGILANIPSQFKTNFSGVLYGIIPTTDNKLTIELDKNTILLMEPGQTYQLTAKRIISNILRTSAVITATYYKTTNDRYILVGNSLKRKGEFLPFIFTVSSTIKPQYNYNIIALGAPIGAGEEETGNIPCLCGGTRVLTPKGYKAVEELRAGEDQIVTSDGRALEFKVYKTKVNNTTKASAPYVIEKDAYGANKPSKAIRVSPLHAVQIRKGVWDIPMFSTNKKVHQEEGGESVEYYHVELPNFYRDNLVCEGLTTESYGRNQVSKGEKVYKYSKSLGGFTRGTLSLTASRSP